MQSFVYKCVQNGLFNGGPDASVVGAPESGPNVAIEGAT